MLKFVYSIKHNPNKTDEGIKVQLHEFLFLALNRGKRSGSFPYRFTTAKGFPEPNR